MADARDGFGRHGACGGKDNKTVIATGNMKAKINHGTARLA